MMRLLRRCRRAGVSLLLMSVVALAAGAGCAASTGGSGGWPIDAWYLFTGEPAPFEGYLMRPSDLERLLDTVAGQNASQ